MSAPVLEMPRRETHDLDTDFATDAAHLRRLIEKQPSCLMRIDLEGHLLAINEAARGLLGAEDLGQALTRSLSERIVPDQRNRWKEFAARIGTGEPASMECDLTNFAGCERSVLLQGVPFLDHPDTVPSVIVSARDTSSTKRLEQVLEKEIELDLDDAIDPRQRADEIQRDLDAAGLEQARLELLIEEGESRRAAELTELRQTLADEHQLAILQAERDARQRLDLILKDLEQALAEKERLENELKDERLTARTAAEKVTGAEVMQSALDAARLECERLRSFVGQQETERDRLIQLQAAALDNVRTLLTEERELALLEKERDARQRIGDAEAGLASALEERQRLRAVLQESEHQRERLLAEQAAQRIEAEHALAAVALARDRVTKAYADQQVELQAVVGNALALEAITGAGRIAREIGRELVDAALSIDRRVEPLLSRTPLDSGERSEIEALRAEALAVASLARQILQPDEPATLDASGN